MPNLKRRALVSIALLALTISILPEPADARGGRGGGGRGRGMGRGMGRYGGMGYGRPGRYGGFAGWARPYNRFRNYGWGGYGGGYGDWGDPYYPNYQAGNYSTGYGGNSYGYVPSAVEAETWTSGSVSAVPLKSIEPEEPKEKIVYKSLFKLGSDADIIEGGKIAFHLTDDAFLLATGKKLVAVDQKSGYPALALYPDEVLLWHLAQELDRQILSQKSAQKANKSRMDSPAIKNSQEKTAALKKQISNLDSSIKLLESARTNLGAIPDKTPEGEALPENGAIEIFASTWMLPSGDFLVVRVEDGSFVYLDGKGTYKDNRKTPLKKAYPGKFELIVFNYLKKLVGEAPKATSDLKDDIDDTQWALEKLKEELEEEYNADGGHTEDDALPESQTRINQAIVKSEHSFAAMSNQVKSMPAEVAAAKKLLQLLQQ